jgi:transglutaminase-like putative cysteine protease
MTAPLALAAKALTFGLVALGFLALAAGGAFSAALAAVAALGLGAAWFADRPPFDAAWIRRAWNVATVGFLPLVVLDVAFLAESVGEAAVHFLLYLTLYKLWTRAGPTDDLHLHLLSFLQVLVATALATSLAFLPILLAYLLGSAWRLILAHLRASLVSLPPAWPAGSARRLLTPRFCVVTSLATLATFLLALAFFFLMPRIGRAYLPLGGRAGLPTIGFTDHVELGTMGRLLSDDTIVMRVRPVGHGAGEKPAWAGALRWRGIVLDRFDGQAWRWTQGAVSRLARSPAGAFLVARPTGRGRPLVQEVFLEPLYVHTLFAASRLLAVEAPFPALGLDAAGGLWAPLPVGQRIRYVAHSEAGEPEDPGEAEGGRLAPPPAYLQLPPLAPRVRALAEKLRAAAADPADAARRAEAHLSQHYRYTLDLGRDRRFDPIEDFLFEQRAGNCEYFATSLAVLLRAMAIPARVVNGFLAGEWNEYGGYFVVRQRDAHSWVEAHLPGEGWRTLDPSPRAASGVGGPATASTPVVRYLDALRLTWTRYVIDWSARDQLALATDLRRRMQAGWGALTEGVGAGLRGRVPPGAWLGAVALGLALLGLALVRRRPGAGEGPRAAPAAVPFYRRLERLLARAGFTRGPARTARELAAEAGARGGPAFGGVAELTALYERVRFGRAPLSPAEADRVEALLGEVRAAVRAARRQRGAARRWARWRPGTPSRAGGRPAP